MDEVEEIKRRLDIVELISTYLTLKKAGANYRALCPFHQEKTPSFMVSQEKQIFKCFGCNEGGDIFSFVMKMENLEFGEALRMLADKAGVKLKTRHPEPEKTKEHKVRLYKINHFSTLVFQKILLSHPAGKAALKYLQNRKITLETIKDFQLGYAPKAKILSQLLLKKGFNPNEIVAAGSPDRFFNRIIFPIFDNLGNIVGFTGRAMETGQEPKYLNTPETTIFHKGQTLYNLHQARGPIKQTKATIVVEGQMDVIASYQAGVKNVVASSGTALTEEHLVILSRYTPNIIFAFDTDSAGELAAKKAYQLAIVLGMNVKMVLLGDFKDPGEMIASNPKLWPEAVNKAVGIIDWYFNLAFEKRIAKGKTEALLSSEKKEIAREILPIIKIIPDKIEQAHFVNLLAKRLSINEEAIFDVLENLAKAKSPEKKPALPKLKPALTYEGLLLGILLWQPAKIKEVASKINLEDFNDPEIKAIYKELLLRYNQEKKINLAEFKESLSYQQKIFLDLIILEVEYLYKVDEDKLEEDLKQTLSHMKSSQKEALKIFYAQEIKKAEEKKDYSKLKKLIKEFQDALN